MPDLNHRAAIIALHEASDENTDEAVNNRGTRINQYLENAGRLPSNPETAGPQYCGMFVYWCYSQAARQGERNPLPRAVFGGQEFWTWAMAHQEKIVYRVGMAAEPILEPGDVFVVANLSHIGMVIDSVHNVDRVRTDGTGSQRRRIHETHRGFVTVEGNQADPVHHPEWGIDGVRRKTILLSGCALIVRP